MCRIKNADELAILMGCFYFMIVAVSFIQFCHINGHGAIYKNR